MSEGMIAAIVAVIGGIFAAGKLFSTTEASQQQTKLDVNRIGQKMRDEERAELRRHFNSSLIQVACEDDRETRFRICGQLKED